MVAKYSKWNEFEKV